MLYRLAKARERKSRDLDQVRCIKDEGGQVIVDEHEIQKRWQRYFSTLLNEGHIALEGPAQRSQTDYNFCRRFSKEEVKEVVRKMKNKKAVGPDEIPVEVWKCLGAKGIEWLTSLFNVIFRTAKMPGEWRLSKLRPLYKNKGDVQ